jgi:hypothetical protein
MIRPFILDNKKKECHAFISLEKFNYTFNHEIYLFNLSFFFYEVNDQLAYSLNYKSSQVEIQKKKEINMIVTKRDFDVIINVNYRMMAI